MSIWRVGRGTGVASAAVGVLAAGAAAGFAAQRVASRRRVRAVDQAGGDGEAYGSLHGSPRTVVADDGARLHVEVEGDDATRPTLVFVHGYALTSDCWHFQRRDLRDVGRLVFYDQRSHGRSGDGIPGSRTLEQLGTDLGRVLDEVAPKGPVVLVGHSMGGMTVMSLAERRPDLFGSRVVGVALLSTSAGKLAEAMLGVPVAAARLLHRAAPRVLATLARRGELVDAGRRLGGDLGFLFTRRYSFASDVSPELVDFTARMIEGTPIDVIADYFPAFSAHDKLHCLDVLNGVETLILAGEDDLMTPADHSREMITHVREAELVIVPQSGHMVILEHPDVVNGHLRDLVQRACPGGGRGSSPRGSRGRGRGRGRAGRGSRA
ncbi:MAG: alpha/beta fold hydrolase [Actinomycetes bacterium]